MAARRWSGSGWSTSRAQFLTGFPWYYLSHSQYRYLPLIQICGPHGCLGRQPADRPGECVVGGHAVAAPAAPARRAGRPLSRSSGGSIWPGRLGRWVLTLAYGFYRLSIGEVSRSRAEGRPDPVGHRAGIQDGAQPCRVAPRLRSARSAKAASRVPRPDLVIWPETSYPFGVATNRPEAPAGCPPRSGPGVSPGSEHARYWRRGRDRVERGICTPGIRRPVAERRHAGRQRRVRLRRWRPLPLQQLNPFRAGRPGGAVVSQATPRPVRRVPAAEGFDALAGRPDPVRAGPRPQPRRRRFPLPNALAGA